MGTTSQNTQQEVHHRSGAARLRILLGGFFVLAACSPFTDSRLETVVSPDVVGVIDQVEVEGDQFVVRVGDRAVPISQGNDGALRLGRSDLNGMLLYGTTPRTWYLTLLGDRPDCYRLVADEAWDEPDAVVLVFAEMKSVGIRLLKAPGFDPAGSVIHDGADAGWYMGQGGIRFCLTESGQVAKAGSHRSAALRAYGA